MAFLNAAQVFGASSSSKRAPKVNSPVRIISWLIWLSRGSRTIRYPLQPVLSEARSIPADGGKRGLLVGRPPVKGPAEQAAPRFLLRRGRRRSRFLDPGLRRRR